MTEVTLLIYRSVWQIFAKAAGLVLMFITLIGLGVLLDSPAMQWAGALIGFVVIAVNLMNTETPNSMTIPEARHYLDKLEGEENDLNHRPERHHP